MSKFYNEVLLALQQENKAQAVTLCLQALEAGKLTVIELYEQVLTPALNNIVKEYRTDEELIWREHVRSGIIRTIIELAYPFILNERLERPLKNEKVMVMCPEYEDHELGARMVSDYFSLAGYDATFIGARTPIHTVLKAISFVEPKYVCISVTNVYNLVAVKRTIEAIKEYGAKNMQIILGGRAFLANPEAYKWVGADHLLTDYASIQNLAKEGF